MRRQLGVMINRRGHLEHVIIGDASRLWLPDVGRMRAGVGRLRGLRLVHTHLRGEGITTDDLTDLSLLRLDLIAALTITSDGRPANCHIAHLIPAASASTPWRILDPTVFAKTQLDPLELVKSLEQELAREAASRRSVPGAIQAVIVHVTKPSATGRVESVVEELEELCSTAGVAVLDTFVQRREHVHPRYMVGRGKLDEVLLRANQLDAELLIFCPDLSAAQARAISDATDLKVIDRTMLILDIFSQRAKSRDGKLQVELAQLRYSLPRLVAKNTMMSRLTGGIGGRGPGETKLEINRRRARERIASLEQQINRLAQQRQRRRALRRRRKIPIVSIIGYTNAGKSSLLNTLTNSETLAESTLFATLDPLSRRLRFPRERELILTDTVGFINELPEDLVNAFRATLEELREADLFIHVIDLADDAYREKMQAVDKIRCDLGVADTPTVLALNKVDLVNDDQLKSRTSGLQGIMICALTAESTRPLLEAVERSLWREDRLPT